MLVLRNLFLLSLYFVISGCSSNKYQLFSKHQSGYCSSGFFAKHEYIIKPHDRISITFYQYPELSTQSKAKEDIGIEVTSSGTVLLPLVGRIKVSGMSKEMLEDKLYKLYSKYLEKSPALKVEVLNQKIYVLGEVKDPGALIYNQQSFVTPLKAIAQRGGLSDFAKRNSVLIVRGNRQKYDIAKLDLTDMRSLAQNNIILQPEDIVYVSHNSLKDINLPLSGMSPSLELLNTLFNTATLYQVIK